MGPNAGEKWDQTYSIKISEALYQYQAYCGGRGGANGHTQADEMFITEGKICLRHCSKQKHQTYYNGEPALFYTNHQRGLGANMVQSCE